MSKQKLKLPSQASKMDSDVYERLIKVGKEHVLRDGVKSLVIRKVGHQAKVNLGSFVYYFGTKQSFVESIIQSLYLDFYLSFDELVSKMEPNTSPLKKLRYLSEAMMLVAKDKGHIINRFLLDFLGGEQIVIRAFEKKPPEHWFKFLEVIKDCQRSGTIRNDLEPKEIYLILFSAVGLPYLFSKHLIDQTKSKKINDFFGQSMSPLTTEQRLDIIFRGLSK